MALALTVHVNQIWHSTQPPLAQPDPGLHRRHLNRRIKLGATTLHRHRTTQQRIPKLARQGTTLVVEVESAVDHLGRGLWQIWPLCTQRKLQLAVLLRQLDGVLRAVRVLARQCLVGNECGRPNVNGARQHLTTNLLGSHVRERAKEALIDRSIGMVHLGNAEVGQLENAVLAQQDVARLDVAMDDAAGMRVLEGITDRRDRAQNLRLLEPSLAQHDRKVVTPDEFKRHEDVVLIFAIAEHAHDRAVIERTDCSHLATRAATELLLGWDCLEGNQFAGQKILRLEDGGTPTNPDCFDNSVPISDDSLRKKWRYTVRCTAEGANGHGACRR
jgi:hypothetical protein